MFFLKSIVIFAVAIALGAEASGVLPAVAAPLVASAQIGYAHAVPQNVPPYASQVSVVSKAINPIIAASPLSAPIVAPAPGPFAAPIAARIAAPYVAGPAPVIPGAYAAAPYAPAAYAAAPYAAGPYAAAPYAAGPYAASPYALPGPFPAAAAYASPYPYSLAAPLGRVPFGVAPAFVR
ncbi:unnamed protein product [Danaus chrysippus]|uniref:(African queen) hypothetical protein n=1 Tax=Danaus chrysippus TaxID=151541 RepID=A0A8J2QI28_9NEOP|nr:unnamed protein product [Danaus chrysippus]